MQVKRWEMATDVSKSVKIALIDGDHLQLIQAKLPVTSDILPETSNSHFNRVFGRDSQSK